MPPGSAWSSAGNVDEPLCWWGGNPRPTHRHPHWPRPREPDLFRVARLAPPLFSGTQQQKPSAMSCSARSSEMSQSSGGRPRRASPRAEAQQIRVWPAGRTREVPCGRLSPSSSARIPGLYRTDVPSSTAQAPGGSFALVCNHRGRMTRRCNSRSLCRASRRSRSRAASSMVNEISPMIRPESSRSTTGSLST